jgi:hypothetical protein
MQEFITVRIPAKHQRLYTMWKQIHHTKVRRKVNMDKTSMKIPKGGNQKPHIEEEQTIQWPKDTKEVIRSRTLKKDRQYNGQMKRDIWTNNDLQNTTHKTKGRATRTSLK